MSVSIVEADLANAAHAAALVDVLDSYARDPIGAGSPLAAEVRNTLIPGLRAHPTTVVFLAWDGPQAIGIAICFRGFSTFRARPLLNVHDLAVVPERRGTGVGRQLLAAAEDRARQMGCGKLTLEVREDNGRARGLYSSFGFVDGQGTRTFFLEKPLA
jgi:ribosomal protein S18 acetylase RimI-like enzyme